MKITKQHYEELKEALSVISPTVKTTYRKHGASKQRFVWDCFWCVCDAGRFKPETLYVYLNDNHIETALRNILL